MISAGIKIETYLMKLLYKKGINDVKGQSETIFYRTWNNMLKRCYSESYQTERPTYVGCSVCDEWLTFSKFKAWMETQDWEGKQLDKDLLIPGNKVYSPDACVFVNQEINKFLIESDSSRGEFPLGVCFDKEKKKFKSYCNVKGKRFFLGYFENAEKAHLAWLDKKLELAYNYAAKQNDCRIAKAIVERYQNYSH